MKKLIILLLLCSGIILGQTSQVGAYLDIEGGLCDSDLDGYDQCVVEDGVTNDGTMIANYTICWKVYRTIPTPIPTDATITGIKIEIKLAATINNGSQTVEGLLTVAGYADLSPQTGSTEYVVSTSGLTWYTFGGDGDMWNETTSTLNPTLFNNSEYAWGETFVLYHANEGETPYFAVDASRITVYYTEAGGTAKKQIRIIN